MIKIKLPEMESQFAFISQMLFNKIISTPKEVRGDDKKRTGIQVLVRQLATANLVNISILNPSQLAKFFVCEKSTRLELLGDSTSEDTKDEAIMRFPGAIHIVADGMRYHVSVSGLQAHEDVAIAVYIAAYLAELSAKEICTQINLNDGTLPQTLYEENHYLNGIIAEIWDVAPVRMKRLM